MTGQRPHPRLPTQTSEGACFTAEEMLLSFWHSVRLCFSSETTALQHKVLC